MKKPILFFAVLLSLSISAFSQAPQSLVKRTITKTDSVDFGSGGTVTITGAPNGSIRVIGTNKNEVEITAEIELQAASEADLTTLAGVTGYFTEEANTHTVINSFGTFNRLSDKKLWKKFPKNLLGLPVRIDYVIKVPHFSDLEIDGGKGDLSVAGVEGMMRINFLETNADIAVLGGVTNVTVSSGKVDIAFGVNGWRSRAAYIQVATGELNVKLPVNLTAEVDASILHTGKIQNSFPDLKPRDRKVQLTEKSIVAKKGVGGASLKFTVGDGTLRMARLD